ncbi:MAG: DUF3089 domain-containing protein, partial [Planctomycetes bacterium]|nr:DUF3089 domain-containing protein [Planctomycetota bacterium]
ASVFNGCCRVYAPRYRQVTFSAFVTRDRADDVRQALDLAYGDVLAAFDFFIKNRNARRPFIIASHSQGSRHAIRLLKDRIEGSALREQLVAAYIIGAAVPADAIKRLFPSIAVCNSALETGCLVAFATFREGADSSAFQDRAEIAYPTGFERTAGKWFLDKDRLAHFFCSNKNCEHLLCLGMKFKHQCIDSRIEQRHRSTFGRLRRKTDCANLAS